MTSELLLMGVEVSRLDAEGVVDSVIAGLGEGCGGTIFSVNVDILRQAHSSAAIRELLEGASLRIPDGAPIAWASRMVGTPVGERVAGSSLILALAERAARERRTVFLLGGNPGVAPRAREELQRRWPDLEVVGEFAPPFGFESDPEAMADIRRRLAASEPDIVFVALGFPKQEYLTLAVREAAPSAWFVSCGIALSFVAGDLNRAPQWLQEIGLEWVHRWVQEPRRLFRRYFVHDLPFGLWLLVWAVRRRVLVRRPR